MCRPQCPSERQALTFFCRLKAVDDIHTGPSLLEDQIAREKIHRFDHERIPERVVHARGAAAHGYFRLLNDSAKKWSKAGVLTDTSRTTPVFVRFSTVQGSKGSAVSTLFFSNQPLQQISWTLGYRS